MTGLDHDLAYRAAASGSTDLIDLYSTDAEINYYHLRVLDDDRRIFPAYEAVYLYRLELRDRAPAVIKAITRLEGAIDAPHMIEMNALSKLQKVPEANVASQFLSAHFQINSTPHVDGMTAQLLLRTREHLLLVGISAGGVNHCGHSAWGPCLPLAPHRADYSGAGRGHLHDPVPRAPSVHDSAFGHWHTARHRRAIPVRAFADRAQHPHWPQRNRAGPP